MKRTQVVIKRGWPLISPSSDVRYGECQKNHAASIGGHAVDGCLEFMATGARGTPTAFVCAACGCHRNFHRKEVVLVDLSDIVTHHHS